jgi:DNA-binding NtrC family response regulator
VLNAIQRCFERSRLARENFVLRREVSTNSADIEGVIGQSEAMFKVCERLRRIAPTPATVLLSGESGTGKEVAARALHRMSPRAGGPFVPVNCAAIRRTDRTSRWPRRRHTGAHRAAKACSTTRAADAVSR